MVEVQQIDGLRDIGEDAALKRFGRGVGVLVPGEHEDGDADRVAPHVRQHVETAHAWHAHVEHDEIELFLAKSAHRLVAVASRREVVGVPVVERFEELDQDLADRRIVVDDQDPLRLLVNAGGGRHGVHDLPTWRRPDNASPTRCSSDTKSQGFGMHAKTPACIASAAVRLSWVPVTAITGMLGSRARTRLRNASPSSPFICGSSTSRSGSPRLSAEAAWTPFEAVTTS